MTARVARPRRPANQPPTATELTYALGQLAFNRPDDVDLIRRDLRRAQQAQQQAAVAEERATARCRALAAELAQARRDAAGYRVALRELTEHRGDVALATVLAPV